MDLRLKVTVERQYLRVSLLPGLAELGFSESYDEEASSFIYRMGVMFNESSYIMGDEDAMK